MCALQLLAFTLTLASVVSMDVAVPGVDVAVPGVVRLSAHNFSSVHDLNGEGWLVSFFSPTCPQCRRFAPELEQLPAALTSSNFPGITIGEVDVDVDAALGGAFSITSLPELRFIKREGRDVLSYTFPMDTPRTADNLVHFVSEGYQTASSAPALGLAAGVVPLSRANISAAYQPTGSGGGWLVAFTSPTCAHCRALEPTLAALATGGLLKLGVRFAAVDLDAPQNKQLGQLFEVDSLPTLRYVKARDLEALVAADGAERPELRPEDVEVFTFPAKVPRSAKNVEAFVATAGHAHAAEAERATLAELHARFAEKRAAASSLPTVVESPSASKRAETSAEL